MAAGRQPAAPSVDRPTTPPGRALRDNRPGRRARHAPGVVPGGGDGRTRAGGDAGSRFYADYDDPSNPITLRHARPFGTASQGERDALTPKQEEALALALRTGYFDVPRETTSSELAEEIGVSNAAVSQRLRRGLSNVLRSSAHVPRPVESAGY